MPVRGRRPLGDWPPRPWKADIACALRSGTGVLGAGESGLLPGIGVRRPGMGT